MIGPLRSPRFHFARVARTRLTLQSYERKLGGLCWIA